MKKVFFLLAVAGMFSFAACNQADQTPTDTVATVEQPTEAPNDTLPVENNAEENAEVPGDAATEGANEVVNQ